MNRVVIGLIGVVVVVAVAGGAFYGGMKVGQNQVIQNPMQYLGQGRAVDEQFPGAGGQFRGLQGTPEPGQPGIRRFAGGSFDTVQSVDGNVVTVSRDGELVRVIITDTTLIQKYTGVDASELEAGEQVIVSGTTNDDGSITARSIRSMSGMQFDMQGPETTQP